MTQSKEEKQKIQASVITESGMKTDDGNDLTSTNQELGVNIGPVLCSIENIPVQVDTSNINLGIKYLLSQHGITEKITHIEYLGGCSNHALKVTIESAEYGLKNVLVRLPGSFSKLLVDREAERVNTAIVAELGICPAFATQFATKGNLLQLEGYKVEAFLERSTSLTHQTFKQYKKMALAQLKRVHECGKRFETEYNLLERLKLMCYSIQDLVGERIFVNSQREGEKYTTIEAIILQIERLETLAKAFGKINLLTCHNDIPPFNFMVLSQEEGMEEIKI